MPGTTELKTDGAFLKEGPIRFLCLKPWMLPILFLITGRGDDGMKEKRLIWLFGGFLLLFGVVTGRLFLLASNHQYAETAQRQMVTRIPLEPSRGNIYDRMGRSVTGGELRYFALSVPGESSYSRLFQYVPYQKQGLLYEKRNALTPFLIEVDRDLNDQGIYTCTVPRRYPENPLAEHLIGYVDGQGMGAAGLESAFEEVLGAGAKEAYLECITTAQGNLLAGTQPKLELGSRKKGGLVLTLDKGIQRACEAVAQQMESGCILVLDTATARVLASVSIPHFDPRHVEKSIQAGDTSLLNRPLCAYNVGSVFKPILAAAALEKGAGWYSFECEGEVDVNDQVYHCAAGRAHGEIDLARALEKSCNCYFIGLGQQLGGQTVEIMAEKFGFGKPVYLAGGMKSACGSLPKASTLKDKGQLANLSFGQGMLTATPLQVAAAMNVIASDGCYRAPAFLDRVINETNGESVEQLYEPGKRQAVRPETAKALREMLVGVVENGLGKDAKPNAGGAGGKTGTAQTGSFTEEKREKMNYWFAGFYPAEKPRYTVLVMQDGILEPKVSSGRLFAQVCDALYWLEAPEENS